VFGLKAAVTSGSPIHGYPLVGSHGDSEIRRKVIYAAGSLGVVHDLDSNRCVSLYCCQVHLSLYFGLLRADRHSSKDMTMMLLVWLCHQVGGYLLWLSNITITTCVCVCVCVGGFVYILL
jgi:hypothetical protein